MRTVARGKSLLERRPAFDGLTVAVADSDSVISVDFKRESSMIVVNAVIREHVPQGQQVVTGRVDVAWRSTNNDNVMKRT